VGDGEEVGGITRMLMSRTNDEEKGGERRLKQRIEEVKVEKVMRSVRLGRGRATGKLKKAE
jgi:hypothetical protein